MTLQNKVFEVIKTIPKGEVMTYKEVAAFAGHPRAYRAVGRLLHKNPDVSTYPCHRVVRSDMTLSKGYSFGGPLAQKKILESEGIVFKKNKLLKN